MSGRNKQKFQLGQSYSYIMRKVFKFHCVRPNKHAKWPPSDLTPWTLTLAEPVKISFLTIWAEQHAQYT